MLGQRKQGLSATERSFARLARAIIRHPWYVVIFWIALLLVALPFVSRLGGVTTNSAATLPSSAPSAMAASELARLFPNSTSEASSIVLLTGPNITGTIGKSSTLRIASALEADKSLQAVRSISTLYSSYGDYLGGQAELANGVIQPALRANPSLPTEVNRSADLLWGPPASFLAQWSTLVAQNPGTNPAMWNYPAYNLTQRALSYNATLLLVLGTFYSGYGGSGAGFNGTAACAAHPANVVNCTDATARANLQPLIGVLVPNPAQQVIPNAALSSLGVSNYTQWPSVQRTCAEILSEESGLPTSWLVTVWNAFPQGVSSSAQAAAWGYSLAANSSVANPPLPIPYAIYSQYVDPSGTATIVLVEFSVTSGYTDASGNQPVPNDVVEINRIVPVELQTTDPTHTLTWYQTGNAALDQFEQTDLSQSLSILLPLTIVVLVLITILYFRAPLTPVITFGSLGIALILGLAGVVLLGTLVTHVDTTAVTLVETFVLGVGTDYAVFLVARYREGLVSGKTPTEALVTSVTWAGQSIATSGSTAIIATIALTFSGIALLSQWGMVLSLAIFITMMIALTLVPALLALLGPRVFWPATGPRFERAAERMRERQRSERTYFYRAGRLGQRRPQLILAVAVVASIPLIYVALHVPISYDFYQQLPMGNPATDGLVVYGNHFGNGAAFPSYSLVTFAAPLLTPAGVNASEFRDLASMSTLANSTSGIHSVQSPVGPYGASLATWLNYSQEPPAIQKNLAGILDSFVGSDGVTVLLGLQTVDSGLSLGAVNAVNAVAGEFNTFGSSHPDVTAVAFGGGAPSTNDLAQQTAVATERLAIAVSIGLFLVLLVVLRSWIIPLLAVATIGLSIAWAWAITFLVLGLGFGLPLFFYVPTVMFILILGLGIDYSIFLLTRVREERLQGRSSTEATVEAVARTGGIITAAAIILASAFAILAVSNFVILRAIGFAVATAIVLDAMIVRTYVVPASLHLLGDRAWRLFRGRPKPEPMKAEGATAGTPSPPAGVPRG